MPKVANTSLSAQLKRLQLPQTNLLSSIADRRRVSFLYDPKEAANLDSEAVYCMAMNGLEQLKLIDLETFESFETTLFSSTSVTFERAIQTKQINEKLNIEIGRFLLHLSPYFMLKPAHKCFEWLVYRYQIHNYNLKEMLMCLLPYHETNYFVRALQMIDLSDSNLENIKLWNWLEDNQKNGVHLAASTLSTHCFSDLAFFNFLNEYLSESIKQFTQFEDDNDIQQSLNQQKIWMNSLNFCFSFMTKTLLQSIKQLHALTSQTDSKMKKSMANNKLEESYFAQLLPVLFEGFKSDILPYKQFSYLICSYLFEKFEFTIETTNKALYQISRGLSTFRVGPMDFEMGSVYDPENLDCIKSAILSICLIVQSQYKDQIKIQTLNNQLDSISESSNMLLSKNFLKKLFKNFREPFQLKLLLTTFDELNETYKIDKFLKCILTRLLNELVEHDRTDAKASNEINLNLDENNDETELKEKANNKYFNFLVELLNLLNLTKTPDLVQHLINYSFQLLIHELHDKLPNLLVEYHLCEIIYKFECKYPAKFDQCLNDILNQSENSLITNSKQRNYFLTTISCKFGSFKCKSTFKYQSLNDQNELNLLISLTNANENLRANGLSYILSELNKKTNKINIDQDFIRDQLDLKFRNESSPLVYKNLLEFDLKLLDYFKLEQLLEDESYLLKLFTVNVFSQKVNMEDDTEEMNELFKKQNDQWSECRQMAIDFIFNNLYKKYGTNCVETKDQFFNCFFQIVSLLFELNSTFLLVKLKTTAFFIDINNSAAHDSNNQVKKPFYNSTSSISITKISDSLPSQVSTNIYDQLNDQFDFYIQLSIKYMQSTKTKDNLIKQPKCFDKLAESLIKNIPEQKIKLIDFMIYEICIRLTAQSLFLMNTLYYFNLATLILINQLEPILSIKIKKSKPLDLTKLNSEKKLNNFSNYTEICSKQTFKNPYLLITIYQSLFKSLSIQLANFVNPQIKLEINLVHNKIYSYLSSIQNHYSYLIINKLMQSSCFNQTNTSSSPNKMNLQLTQSNNSSFFQFAFKFLIHLPKEDKLLVSTQLRTIELFNQNLNELLNDNKKYDYSLLNATILMASWCLTNENAKIRTESLNLLESIYNLAQKEVTTVWSSYLKRILKHRQEIEIDGADYMRTKCLNKILSNSANKEDNKEICNFILNFLSQTFNSNKNKHNLFYYFDDLNSKLILNEFKYCLLDLIKNLKDDIKLDFMEKIFNLVLNILNDTSSNTNDDLDKLNLNLISLIVDNYMLTSKSSTFFHSNEKYFDYLIGYLNTRNVATKAGHVIEHFKQSFINIITNSKSNAEYFYNDLNEQMQMDLLKSIFDITTSNLECLLSFNLNSKHYICLLNEKAKVYLDSNKSQVNSTKEMRKQMAKEQPQDLTLIDWKSLKIIVELIQASLIRIDNQMDLDLNPQNDHFIELIPFIFNILDLAEQKLNSINSNVPTQKEDDDEIIINEQDEFLYIEIVCVNSLLSIYKQNKNNNKSKLDQSKFNIELLMQILQTHRDLTDSNNNERLNVQEQILLLLSEISAIFPDKVLEHVLIMFVFVGTKLARKDDSYSFQIITKIIKTILPSIVSNSSVNSSKDEEPEISSSNRLKNTVNVIQRHQKELPYVSSLVCKILQSFVVALPHIPAHRKTIIFNQLLEIIGLNDYLWITIIQSIDYYLVQSNDLLDFTNNLEELTSKQLDLLANDDNTSNEAKISVLSKNEKKLRDTLKTCIQSMISLHTQFEPPKLIKSSIYLIAFLNKYFTKLFEKAGRLATSMKATNTNFNKQVYSHLACQLDNYNLLQMKYLAYNLLTFVTDLLVSEDLIVKMAHIYSSNSNNEEYAQLFQDLLEKILLLIFKMSQIMTQFEQQQTEKDKQSLLVIQDLKKFHRAILNKSYDLMEKTINLLDSRQFIHVIKKLLKHDIFQIRRRALTLLNNKLRKYEPNEEETTLLISMIDDLLNSIILENVAGLNQVEIEINNQSILFSIKLLCKRIGEENPLAFVKVIKYLTDNLVNKKLYIDDKLKLNNSNVLSSVLLCIGEVCLKLKSNALIYLNQIMLFNLDIIDLIKSKIDQNNESIGDDLINLRPKNFEQIAVTFKNNELLILSCVTCLLKIVQNMANFLSPYLQRLFHISCSMSFLARFDDNESINSSIEVKLTQLRSTLATLIPLRLLAPILNEQSLQIGLPNGSNSYKMKIKQIEFYMQLVRSAIQQSNQEDLIANIRQLRSMFMNLFEMRPNYSKITSNSEPLVTKEISKYEQYVINAFCELTFKLSEDLFRPIFFKIYEWATINSPPKENQIVFYQTTLKLSDKLKNLFVLFASHFVQNAADLLNLMNSSKTTEKYFDSSSSNEKEKLLLFSVIDTLSNVFLNDSQRTFFNKERFNLLLDPLVDQIENEIEYENYRKFVNEHLGPCIANLAACCVHDDTLCRKFNYQILLKTKHSSVQVRLATLDVLEMFSRKVGDVYNSLLSETVPFLAELMEGKINYILFVLFKLIIL
jgi:hypothetical protein